MNNYAVKSSRNPYRKYPCAVRAEIARSGNVYLFPNMKIPRTTAQYWTRANKPRPLDQEQLDSIYGQQNESLKLELEKERALGTSLFLVEI